MKLLFDENLPQRLVDLLADVYPQSCHVSAVGLRGATDAAIREYAAREGYILVTKDEDFHRMSEQHGGPPKVVWLRTGNVPTLVLAARLRQSAGTLNGFYADEKVAYLELR